MEETRRIVPIIDVELKKKIEKADIVSKDKKDGIKKSRVRFTMRYLIYLLYFFHIRILL